VKRILLHASGTLGDHLPFLALGRALARRGHHVRFAVNSAMRDLVLAADFETEVLPEIARGPAEARANAWAWDHWNNPDPATHACASPPASEGLVDQARALAGLCRKSDLLLTTSIRFLGLLAQRATGIPWITLSVNPQTFGVREQPEERDGLVAGGVRQLRSLRPALAAAWQALGIRSPLPEWSPGWNFAPHVLLGSSVHFSRPDPAQLQPWHSLDQTGFWFYEDPSWTAWRPDPELEAFCARRPIVLAFSSQPLEDPGAILRKHVEAAALLGLPLLVQHGWAGFSEQLLPAGTERGAVLFTDFLPQDWLFARAACAIQHGGIGSLARALRQGCPVLVEPFGNDQLYNARRIQYLGAGTIAHPFNSSAEDLAALLREHVLTEERRRRAAAIGARMNGEDGLGRACTLIETQLAHPHCGDDQPLWRTPALGERRRPAQPPVPPQAVALPADASAPRAAAVPRILHHVWMQGEPPADLAAWRQSWVEHHPSWEHRLWDEGALRELVREHYGWFLPIWDGYPELIMRADAGRYFLLDRFGGVCLDMDLECLRPLGPLLEGTALIASLEPELHRAWRFPNGGGPRHLFWAHLFKELVRSHKVPDALYATGPILLSGACESWPGREQIDLAPAPLFYPFDVDERWEELEAGVREVVRSTAFAVHHWRGDWWRPLAGRDPEKLSCTVMERGRIALAAQLATDWLPVRLAQVERPPLISCLMVTRDRPELARRAVHCFLRQSYPNRELVIVDDGGNADLETWCRGLGDATIRYVRLPRADKTLGELRNLTVESAAGELLAQWDDDDLSDPRRLELQVATLLAFDATACLLERQQVWWPGRQRMALSSRRLWEGSAVVRKTAVGAYPAERRGEDTPVVEALVSAGRVVLLDAPWLYTYIHHGANVWDAARWEEWWERASQQFEGASYAARVRQLLERVGLPLSPAERPLG
jgi:UDP:flavonoid glycosyltransferase YjiC (YdhE family)